MDATLQRLAARLLAQRPGETADVPPEMLAYLQRILNSRLLPADALDEATIVERIQRKLPSEAALKFAALHRQLTELGRLKSQPAILHLLLTLSDQDASSKFVQGAFLKPTFRGEAPADKPAREVPASIVAAKPVSSSETMPTVARTPAASAARVVGFEEYRRVFAYKDQPTERALLRDVLFVMQGIDGQLIRYDAKLDGYVIDHKALISAPQRSLLRGLSVLGWHYRHTSELLRKRTAENNGLVSQSLCTAIQEELLEYHRLLVVLESQLDVEASENQLGGLTLKRLLVWVHQPLERLKILHVILECCKDMQGGALISGVYEYAKHGDSLVSTLVDKLLGKICEPYFVMLRKWVIEGRLINTFYDEFLVAEQSTKPDHDVWTARFILRAEMVPSFFSKQLCNNIFLIGKSINFIRDVCNDKQWSLLDALKSNGAELPSDERWLTYSDLTALSDVVARLKAATSSHLLHLLQDKHMLQAHLAALKRYLLTGQGDLMLVLMDTLWADLAKPATTLYTHQLNAALHIAVRASNAQYDSPDILGRLSVRLLEINSGDSGWDVFTLDYAVNAPLNSIINSSAMKKYYRLFRFLWHTRRVQQALHQSWRGQAALRPLQEATSVLHQAHLLRAEMTHFLSEVQYYILFEVLECSWDDLQHDLAEAADLDQVIAAHELYLSKLTSKALLESTSKPIQTRLQTILRLIVEFQQKQMHLLQLVEGEHARRDALRKTVEKRTAAGGWGITGKETGFDLPPEAQEAFTQAGATLQNFAVQYRSNLRLLIDETTKSVTGPTTTLRSLASRLDFNGYYETQRRQLMA